MNKETKTPKFDKELEKYFTGLKLDQEGGQKRICRFSGKEFYVRPVDIEFYKKMKVPLPTLAVRERWRALFAYFNSYNFFKIKSAHSGNKIIAIYPPSTPYKIYEHQIWFSDKWDPMDFGMDIDNDKDFFIQWGSLQKDVPRPNLFSYGINVNSDYTNDSVNLKDSYLTFGVSNGENLYYIDCCSDDRDCVDGNVLSNCGNCYDCQIIYDCYNCFFCEQSRNCLDSYFLYDCRNCDNCFMCSNLRNKKYYFLNKPLSKEEYKNKLKEINLGNYEILHQYLTQYGELKKNAIYKQDNNTSSVNCLGDYIDHCQNCYWVYFGTNCQNYNYSAGSFNYKDSYDVFGGFNGERCYEFSSMSSNNSYGVMFSAQCDNCRDIEYCDLCRNCHDCFGCIGLSNKQNCIFNKQYTEEEYWRKVDELKSAMLKRGEYGEFFPPQLMPISYRLSFVSCYEGLRDFDMAGKNGYDLSNIADEADRVGENDKIIKSSELPLDIKDVKDDILNQIIFDEKNRKHFQLTPYELNFYRKYNLAIPREHPLMRLRNFRDLYHIDLSFFNSNCDKCGKDIVTTHDRKDHKIIYCESCYQQEVV